MLKSGPQRPVTAGATGGGDEPWPRTIRLPTSFRRRLAAEYEFIVLSEAYNFSSEELGRQASRYIEPYSVVNAMLIKRMPRQTNAGQCGRLLDDERLTSLEAGEVERA
ncbi:hypothetical protein SCUP234_01514 [Seiridium cupressi]